MNDSTVFLILGICGLVVVVLGLIVFVFSLIFRFTGRNFIGFLSLLLRNAQEDEDGKPVVSRRPNLRAIADAQDFDATLAKHVVQDEGVVTSTELQAQSKVPPPAPPGFEDVSKPLESRRRRSDGARRKPRSDGDSDMFGGLLSDDEEDAEY
jgi:hypothetical protein